MYMYGVPLAVIYKTLSRWKAYLLTSRNYIGRCLLQHKELIYFGNSLLELVTSVIFRKIFSDFHDQLHKDIKSIRKSNNVFIFAYKTGNVYKTNKENYNNLLTEKKIKKP